MRQVGTGKGLYRVRGLGDWTPLLRRELGGLHNRNENHLKFK